MYFHSLSAALAMDGHGAYVWSAYLIATIVVVVSLISPWRREKVFLDQLCARLKREEARSGSRKEPENETSS